MPDYSGTALMGYAKDVLKRDKWTCTYCGLNGHVWPNWLYLSIDHLLPKGHALRDDRRFIVAACIFCSVSHNRTGFAEPGDTPAMIVAKKRKAIMEKRAEYQEFWIHEVAPHAQPPFDALVGPP